MLLVEDSESFFATVMDDYLNKPVQMAEHKGAVAGHCKSYERKPFQTLLFHQYPGSVPHGGQ